MRAPEDASAEHRAEKATHPHEAGVIIYVGWPGTNQVLITLFLFIDNLRRGATVPWPCKKMDWVRSSLLRYDC
jgi:hypothetical protein